MSKLFTPKSFKTWKAKSWINHCQDLGMEVQKCNMLKLGMPSLEQRFQTNAKSWPCLGRLSHEIIGLMLKLFPQKFKTWATKSWIVQSLSRLGGMELQKYSILKLETWKNCRCQVCLLFSCVFMSWKAKSWKTWQNSSKLLNPTSFKTWKAKSWECITCQNLAHQVLTEKKYFKTMHMTCMARHDNT